MPYFILAIALASILLVGCSFGGTVEERQKRAQDILDTATANVTMGLEEAKRVTGEIGDGLTDASKKLEETATKIEETAGALQEGVQKITTAVDMAKEAAKEGKEGIDQVRNTLQPVEPAEEEESETK